MHIIKPALALFLTSVVVIAALTLVYSITEEPIRQNQLRRQETAMAEVLPQAELFAVMNGQATDGILAIHVGLTQDDVLVGYVFTLSPEGYSGNIDMMVGISVTDKVISGVRIMRHTETPGLGALAARADFYTKFDNLPLQPLSVVKHGAKTETEIDAITSSTITTKAIVDAVNEAIAWVTAYELH